MTYLIRVLVGKAPTLNYMFWSKSAKTWVWGAKETFETLEEAENELGEANENLPKNVANFALVEIFPIPELT